MYLKLWVESIATAVMTAVAFIVWRTIWIGAGTFDLVPGISIGVMAAMATAIASIMLMKLITTIRFEAGCRRRYARWADQDRAQHQARWEAAAETALSASRKQFTDGLRNSTQ